MIALSAAFIATVLLSTPLHAAPSSTVLAADPVLPSSTVVVADPALPSSTLLDTTPVQLSSTILANNPTLSATIMTKDISIASIQVRQVSIKGSSSAALTLPDGNARVVVENHIGASKVRLGGHYNFYNGLIEAWVTYAHDLWKDGPLFQIAASDHIGLGQLYYRERVLERTREIPMSIGKHFSFGSFQLRAGRAAWLLAPLDAPGSAENGQIDSVGLQFATTNVIPDVGERLDLLRPDTTALEYKRAFRNFGADYTFERVSVDVRDYLPGIRSGDETLLRVYAGQAFNILSNRGPGNTASTELPIRETFALGGAGTLKGYQGGEFRGAGILVLAIEYALVAPVTWAARRIRLDIWQAAVLLFVEEGRIQDLWGREQILRGDAFKWSAGMGVRFKGKWLNSHKSVVRLYAAQSGEYPARKPVYYALLNVGEW